MSPVKREKWTEAEIDALPLGEHDYFERKSGLLFNDTNEFLGALAKAASAFANSGGGHLILGVDNAGVPDGSPTHQGRTTLKDWLEQKIPHLVDYALSDFRVHIVERFTPSRIPSGREVIVIDIGDSALAPHQCLYGGRKYVYYHRRAGRSEPAPHFYLELLRQRLVNPVLEVNSVGGFPEQVKRTDKSIFLAMRLWFAGENIGRVAAYKWKLQIRGMDGYADERLQDYVFDRSKYPSGMSFAGGVRFDYTILPGDWFEEDIHFGVHLRPPTEELGEIRREIDQLLCPVTLRYRIATESSPGELRHVKLANTINVDELFEFVRTQLNIR